MAKDKVEDVLNEASKEQFTEEEVAQGMSETVAGKRRVTIDGLGDLILKYPDRETEIDADAERSKAYTRFLRDGLLTEDEMEQIARERGLWTDEHENRLTDIQKDMIRIQTELADVKSGVKRRKLQAELLKLRQEFTQLAAKKNSLFTHTVESKCQSLWWQYLVYKCTYRVTEDDEEERYWKSWKEFLSEVNSAPTINLMTEFISFYNGLSDNFFDLWLGEGTEQPNDGENDGESQES